uniref:Uncharacterized protein n=1 Tax=Anguilla anguilla TaxID=7936 RepID=A0A0E9SM03_ANGAN
MSPAIKIPLPQKAFSHRFSAHNSR